jgi:hypothetical protein
MTKPNTNTKGDFVSLREAFVALADIYRLGGTAKPHAGGVKLAGIPRSEWGRLADAAKSHGAMMKSIIQGSGQRSSVSGRKEVVLAVIATDTGGTRHFEVAGLEVLGRGSIKNVISVSSAMPDWKDRLLAFVNWDEIDGVIAAAEGNNQRAMIGLVLQLAGIGRGRLEMVEADLPQEADEAAHVVRGADWMKAGLPRFECAAGEAIFYLMRMRSVHARMVKTRKQGYYTSMALAALTASGVAREAICAATGMSDGLVTKLTPAPRAGADATPGLKSLGPHFEELEKATDPEIAFCAARVWKGAAIFARILDWRARVGASARIKIGEGDDLVEIAATLKVARRDLIRILSVRQEDIAEERRRFVSAIIDPALVRSALAISK